MLLTPSVTTSDLRLEEQTPVYFNLFVSSSLRNVDHVDQFNKWALDNFHLNGNKASELGNNYFVDTSHLTSEGLAKEAKALELSSLTQAQAIEIGSIAQAIGLERKLPIAVEVRMKDWIVFHASLPGSTPNNDWWIGRKARAVNLTGRSTLHERVLAEEQGIDWHQSKGVEEEFFAIHGGGLALNVVGLGLTGVLIVSGLEQVADHMLGVEIITEYLARKGEQL